MTRRTGRAAVSLLDSRGTELVDGAVAPLHPLRVVQNALRFGPDLRTLRGLVDVRMQVPYLNPPRTGLSPHLRSLQRRW